MTIMSGLIVYLVIWWVVIFAVLPWAVKRETNPQPGHDIGAPQKTYLWQKFLITTIISTIIWFIVNYIINSGLIRLSV